MLKKRIINFTFLSLILLSSSATSKVSTSVETNSSNVYIENSAQAEVSEDGQVQTRIETEVNGVKREITSDQPGEIKMTIKDGQVTQEVNSTPSPSPTTKTSSSTFDNIFKTPISNPISELKKQLENFLHNFLSLFFRLDK